MRIIDADALKEVIWNNVYLVQDVFNSRDCGMFWTGGIEKAIDEAPTIDIDSIIAEHENIGYEKGYRDGYAEAVDTKPVRHGHWIKSEKSDFCWECSECGYGLTDNKLTYCYDCGAKMDLDEVNDETD